jgi:hypothetical protein
MDDPFNQEEFFKNIYVIRHKLSMLKPVNYSHWEYGVGVFKIYIYPYLIQDDQYVKLDNPLRHDKLSVILNETNKFGNTSSISLRDDPRFNTYEPIQYYTIDTPNGKINLSNGDNMPLTHLCELIRYLHRLSNLTAFM